MENKFYYYGKKATDIVGSESHGITIVCCPPPAPLSPLSPPPPYPPLSSLPAPPNSNHTIIPHHPRKCTTHLKSNFFIIKSLSLFFWDFQKKFEDRPTHRQSTVIKPLSVSQKEIASIFEYTTNQLTLNFPDNDGEVRFSTNPKNFLLLILCYVLTLNRITT